MKLNIKERVSIPSLCPIRGADIITQTLVRDILKKVALTQAEMKKIKYRPSNDGLGVQWEADVLPLKSVTFSELELGILKSQVEKLDKEKKVSQEILSLCLKVRDEKTKTKHEK